MTAKANDQDEGRHLDRRAFLTAAARVGGMAAASIFVPGLLRANHAGEADGTTPVVTIKITRGCRTGQPTRHRNGR